MSIDGGAFQAVEQEGSSFLEKRSKRLFDLGWGRLLGRASQPMSGFCRLDAFGGCHEITIKLGVYEVNLIYRSRRRARLAGRAARQGFALGRHGMLYTA